MRSVVRDAEFGFDELSDLLGEPGIGFQAVCLRSLEQQSVKPLAAFAREFLRASGMRQWFESLASL